VRLETLDKWKMFNELIKNRTSDLQARSITPPPSTIPHFMLTQKERVASCLRHAPFWFVLQFIAEDGGDVFLPNVDRVSQDLHGVISQKTEILINHP
jgi:hypothetical protein